MTDNSKQPTDRRLTGTVQVDVDELWVYQEASGGKAPENSPPVVYREGVPRILDLFDRYGIKATFFVCGRDLPAQKRWLAEMTRRGHEVANHTQDHPNRFARLSQTEKRAQIANAHDRIGEACGRAPVGFKSPGYSFDPAQLELLAELGYRYDSSILATPFGPLLRGLQHVLSRDHVDETRYGTVLHGMAPLQPYRPDPRASYRRGQPSPGPWEAAVSTMPILRLPIHSTFVLTAGTWLFDAAMALLRATRTPVNYSLHGADAVDRVDDPSVASFKFLVEEWETKRTVYDHILAKLAATYRMIPTRDLVALWSRSSQEC